jgi:hypothetical protein
MMPVRTDQSLPHPVKRLQVKLIGGLRRHKLHRRTLHCLGNGLSVAKIVLLPLGVRPHILRPHQPGVVAKRLKLAAEVIRTDTGSMPIRHSGALASRAST